MENGQNSLFIRVSQWLKRSLFVKLFSIGFIILLLLIPLAMVKDQIYDREGLLSMVERDISSKWGKRQVITGPILTVPYQMVVEEKEGKEVRKVTYTKHLHILPEQLNITGELEDQTRKRGIYEVVLYSANIGLKGRFELPENLPVSKDAFLWDQARVAIGISDMVGIDDIITLQWNDRSLRMQPGTSNQNLLPSGVSERVLINGEENAVDFKVDIRLKGHDYLGFTPVGRETSVALSSSWPSPSFSGTFLPDNHVISSQGFEANWKVLDLNRNYPQSWSGTAYTFNQSDFGVRLVQPVDEYDKNQRTAKYAVLVIALTFLIYFFFEMIKGIRVHPFQYLLIGLAISLFYLLLLSISEHLGFNQAYLIGAVSTISLIVSYSSFMLKSRKMTGQLALLLGLIYTFIFVVLQLEDYALLVGSIGLFVTLAIVMLLSRKVDWYRN